MKIPSASHLAEEQPLRRRQGGLVLTVLLVNDHEAQRYALLRTLEMNGFSVRTAGTGAEALVEAANLPDVIVLDVGLPDMSGFDVCRLLKADARTAGIPIVFLSATYQSGSSRNSGDQVGGAAYLFQPVDPATLTAVIQGTLARASSEKRSTT